MNTTTLKAISKGSLIIFGLFAAAAVVGYLVTPLFITKDAQFVDTDVRLEEQQQISISPISATQSKPISSSLSLPPLYGTAADPEKIVSEEENLVIESKQNAPAERKTEERVIGYEGNENGTPDSPRKFSFTQQGLARSETGDPSTTGNGGDPDSVDPGQVDRALPKPLVNASVALAGGSEAEVQAAASVKQSAAAIVEVKENTDTTQHVLQQQAVASLEGGVSPDSNTTKVAGNVATESSQEVNPQSPPQPTQPEINRVNGRVSIGQRRAVTGLIGGLADPPSKQSVSYRTIGEANTSTNGGVNFQGVNSFGSGTSNNLDGSSQTSGGAIPGAGPPPLTTLPTGGTATVPGINNGLGINVKVTVP